MGRLINMLHDVLHALYVALHKTAIICGEILAFLVSPLLMKIVGTIVIFMALAVRTREIYLMIRDWKKK